MVSLVNIEKLKLSDMDLDFLVEAAAPEVADKPRLKQIIREDEDFRSTFLREEKVFRKVITEDDILLKISPALYFQILLRKALNDLENGGFDFSQYDSNGDGLIDLEDEEVLQDMMSEQIFIDRADINQDSLVDRHDYHLYADNKGGMVDVNEDGNVDREDYADIVHTADYARNTYYQFKALELDSITDRPSAQMGEGMAPVEATTRKWAILLGLGVVVSFLVGLLLGHRRKTSSR